MGNLDSASLTVASDVSNFTPEPGTVYIYGRSNEERSNFADELIPRALGTSFVRILNQTAMSFEADAGDGRGVKTFMLKGRESLTSFFRSIQKQPCHLDITGLAHHVWAPLLRAALFERIDLTAVYVEPEDYRPNPHAGESDIFDLSSRISGISPIPGFASLSEPTEDGVCFVPLLGFEGARLSYLIEQVQPPGGKIVPIVGVPGFRMEYPFHTYQGNRTAFLETRGWHNIRYAKANCPFTLVSVLQDIATDYASDYLKIAPIGTKPHALGAVLFVLSTDRQAELVYDHPIRKPERTTGSGRVLRYPLVDYPIIRK
jgi:hypothetical protein